MRQVGDEADSRGRPGEALGEQQAQGPGRERAGEAGRPGGARRPATAARPAQARASGRGTGSPAVAPAASSLGAPQ